MLGFSRHKSTKGVTTIAPTPSPNHHVHQMVQYIDQLANPPNAKVVTPTVALTAVLTIAAKKANLKISCALSKKRPLAAKRFYQVTAQHSLKGVSNADTDRSQRGASRRQVGQECTKEDRRPNVVAKNKERSKANPGRNPYCSGTGIYKGKLEPKLRCDKVRKCKDQNCGKVATFLGHGFSWLLAAAASL